MLRVRDEPCRLELVALPDGVCTSSDASSLVFRREANRVTGMDTKLAKPVTSGSRDILLRRLDHAIARNADRICELSDERMVGGRYARLRQSGG